MSETTVLIVDDDRTMVRLCERLLERASYNVLTAMDPLAALRTLESQKVDLLLSDIRMPIMDGFELISQARQVQPELSVLIMTGYGSIENAIQALHRGVDGLILKPFENSAELIQAVQRVLDESRQKRDAARLQALRPLFDVSERLLAETSPHTLEKLILNTVETLFQASYAAIYQYDQQKACLQVVRTVEARPQKSVTRLEHLLQQAVDGAVPVAFNASGPASNGTVQELLGALGWETMMVAPVQRDSQFVLCASRETGSTVFTEADLELFVILARQAAVAMENAHLYSALKDYVHRVEESQRALIQAEKMAAVGRLMASLAHEINNPLQAVRNCLHLAARKGINNEQRFIYLNMTDTEVERLVTTVRRMLDFYRPGGAEKEHVHIQHVINQVLLLLGPQLREQKIQVHVHCEEDILPVLVVPDQIQQVVFNLILNAMDALEENHASSPKAKEIWVDVYQEGCEVRVTVEDSGPGIQAEMQGRIFEPFVSTKQSGTGLGLAVSYGIMERHQGNLTIIPPRYGTGACFMMALPAKAEGEDGKNLNR